MKKAPVLFIVWVLFLSGCQSTVSTPDDVEGEEVVADTARRMDDFVQAVTDSLGFSGSILLAIDGDVVLKKGYGLANDSLGIPVDSQTVFTIGSITKQFTGAAILKLEEMGRLSVSNTLGQYFPEAPADKQDISIHQLLTHSAGFPGAIGDDADPVGTDDFLAQAMQVDLLFPPGTRYEYSNVGYSLAGIIIEQVSGMSYEAFLRKHFFTPAGMAHTGYILPNWEEMTLAQGYRRGRHWGTLLDRPWREDGPGWHLRANGGILSTPQDMYRWHLALLGDEVLSDASKEKYYARHIEEGEGAGTYYGYGWAIFPTPRGTDLITHNGGNGIFFADMYRYLEEDVFLFIATNRASRAAEHIPDNLLRMVFQPGFEPRLPAPEVARRYADLTELPQLAAMVKLLRSGDSRQLAQLVEEFMAPGMQEMAPMEQHLDILGRIGAQLQGAEIGSIVQRGGEYEIAFTASGGESTRLLLVLNPAGKIVGMNVA